MIKEVSILRKEVEKLREDNKYNKEALATIIATLELHNMVAQNMSTDLANVSGDMAQVLTQIRSLRDRLQQIVNRVEMLETVYEKT